MIPKSWKLKPLSEVADVQTGIAKGGRRITDTISLPYLRVANVQDGYLDLSYIKNIEVEKSKIERYMLKYGDVLLTEGGDFDKLGRGAVWKDKIKNCLHQNHVFAVRPNTDLIISEFLSILTGSQYGKTYFLKCSKQSTNLASINSSQLKEFPVLLPPINEQLAIVELISTWDITVEKIEQLIKAKEIYYTWLLSQVMSNSNCPRIHIRDVAREISSKNKNKNIDLVLSVTNKNGFVLPEDHFERRVASSDLSNYKIVTKGQYAYNPSRINVGSIARLDKWDEGVLSPMYVVFELDKTKVMSDYFLHWLNSDEAKQRISKSVQGSVRETVNFDDFGAILIPLPSIKQQTAVVEVLNSIQREVNFLKKQLEAYRKQKQGLMQKLLTGKWHIKAKKIIQ